jgi:RNA polymerase sigma-70 factor (ECF subfamily)
LQEKDRGELLRRALTRLSPEHRQIIDLVYYHEKSIDEVAHILDVPPATVKTRMFYARKKLAALVKGGLRSCPGSMVPIKGPSPDSKGATGG